MALVCCFVCVNTAFAGERVEVFFNVPDGLAGYTGKQPVTFGVPFSRGALKATDAVRLVDEKGSPLPGQFEVTGTWGPGSNEVRWLLVDCFADIRKGKPRRAFLEFGADLEPAKEKSPLNARKEGGRIRIDTGEATFAFDRAEASIGRFVLRDGKGVEYFARGDKVELEKTGPVRAVVKITGQYADKDGNSIADFVTRVRLYAGCSFARVYHTMIWTVDDSVQIGGLEFVTPNARGKITAGIDGKSVSVPADSALYQKDWNILTGTVKGRQLDGWIATPGCKGVFAALRWPWQQFPTSLRARDGDIVVGMIGPEKPMSLAPMDAAVDAVKKTGKPLENGGLDSWDINANVGLRWGAPDAKQGLISPRGVAKTYELLVWLGDSSIPATTKNVFAQHPVLGYADPAFAVRAALPSPASPVNTNDFPVVESALKRAFGWATREVAIDGDFGTWNYGDLQWSWREQGGYAVYRYWMNHGKGWSIVPWALWLRSGDRAYWENGEANSRHCMDVDICHLDDRSTDVKTRDGKIRGGMYHYCALHWAYGPRVLTFYSDSEYLPNYYHMTGYERARDVMMERAEALIKNPAHFDQLYERMQNPQNHARHLYAAAKDILLLYEATWDPTLGKYAGALVELILKGQEANGHFFGVKTNHYLDQMLHIARRVLPDKKDEIARAITKWVAFNGDNERGGPVINIENGWMSLWSLLVAAEQAGNDRTARMASRIMNSQAAVVDDSTTDWRGINPIFLHELGPALRDWPIVMAALSNLPADKRESAYEPMTYICGKWEPSAEEQAAGWKYREAALLLSEKGEALQAKIHLWGGGVGEMACRIRVRAPDNSVVLDEDRTTTFAGQYGAKDKQTADSPLLVEIPGGKPGVYILEFLMKDRRPCMHIRPSNGKVLYLLNPKGSNFLHSPVYTGQVWFEPSGKGPIVFSQPAVQIMGRMTLFGPNGEVLATSQATGTRQVNAEDHGLRPEGPLIQFDTARSGPGLYSLLTPVPRDKNCYTHMAGCKPWFAARKSEWFDPMKYPNPNLESYVVR